jgi:hypothetical protein
VAEFSREEESSTRIIAQLTAISERRYGLRRAIENHNIETHARVAAASGNR